MKAIPHQREPYKHSNHGIMDGPQYCSNPRLQQYKVLLLNAWPIQWFDFPLSRMNNFQDWRTEIPNMIYDSSHNANASHSWNSKKNNKKRKYHSIQQNALSLEQLIKIMKSDVDSNKVQAWPPKKLTLWSQVQLDSFYSIKMHTHILQP